MWTLFVALLLMLGVAAAENVTWANTLTGMLSRSCMYGFGVSAFYSVYDEVKKDRMWLISCSEVNMDGPHYCKWTYNFANSFHEKLDFQCEAGYYIAGLYSDYNCQKTDRTWRIECCRLKDHVFEELACVKTASMNTAGELLHFSLPPDFILIGIASEYVNPSNTPDRLWNFTICEVPGK